MSTHSNHETRGINVTDENSSLILQELQLLRADFNDFARSMGERVSSLEIQVKSGITGNGQPSRLAIIEQTVGKLVQWRWWMVGAAAGSSAVISALAWVFEVTLKH